jgi:hypothetical protein
MLKDDKHHKNQSERVSLNDDMQISTFMWDENPTSVVELDLSSLVDGYDYHDFPSTVSIYWSKEEIKVMLSTLSDVLEYMNKLEENRK